MTVEADFSGYATRNNLRCSDGRTILPGAFEENHGGEVPLLWMHGHDDPTNVLGHVKLENVEDGVKAYAFFNKTPKAQHAKEMVRNGDVKWLSIFANQLIERSKQVLKGNIREVSLVLAGANPGATIENVAVAHSDGEVDVISEEAYLTTGIEVEVMDDEKELALAHAATATKTEDGEETLADILATLNPKQENAVNFLLSQALSADSAVKHDDMSSDDDGEEEETEVEETEENSDAAEETDESSDNEDEADEGTDDVEADAYSADVSAEEDSTDAEDTESEDDEVAEGGESNTTENEAGDDAVQHDTLNQEDNSMTHNLFDQSQGGATASATHERQYLSHDAMKAVVTDTLKKGSLKTALEDYALAHGIENIEFLFPDAKLLENSPNYLARRVEWVDKVLNSVRRTPFSRIKTIHADITEEEARARGYIKGNLKKEEFFKLIKRTTVPQTVYKKQKLDRDDVLDITDLDVVAWMKAEMKLMLSEEIAGAILIGDGRSNSDEDKIDEEKIRPIATDDELYTSRVNVNLDDASSSIEELIDAVISSRPFYRGTGTPAFYTTESTISKFLTVKDGFGHRLYKTLDDVAQAMRVSEIVPVEVMENRAPDLVGVMVNLVDYSIGTDRGGEATMFDDFDLDYNKLRYLLETRVSGALTIPKAAIAFWKTAGSTVILAEPQAPARVDNTITVPTVSNVTYKNADTNATLTTGSPVTLAEGEELNVVAVAASGYAFPSNQNDQWHYEYDES